MEYTAPTICLAVVQCADKQHTSFINKKAYTDFLQENHGKVRKDEALVILQGGSSQTTTLAAAADMPWIIED